jgi:hypothetical protein
LFTFEQLFFNSLAEVCKIRWRQILPLRHGARRWRGRGAGPALPLHLVGVEAQKKGGEASMLNRNKGMYHLVI